MLYFALAFELIAIVFLSYGTEKLWAKYINNKLFRFLLLPGAIAHALSHALLCLITGATIKNLNIFNLNNDDVQFEKPKILIIGNFLIAAAPIFGCGIILLFLAVFLGSAVGENQDVAYNNTWFKHLKELAEIIKITLNSFWKEINLHKIPLLIFIPLSIIFTVSMAPARKELKILVLGFIILAAIPFYMEKFGFSLKNYDICKTLLNGLWHLITLSITVLVTVLSISAAIIAMFKGIKLTFSQKGDGKSKAKAQPKTQKEPAQDKPTNL